MAMQSSPESPQPLGRVVLAVKDWVGRLGSVWVDAQVIELRRRAGKATHFLTLRDRYADVSATVTCSTFVLDSAGPLTEGSQVTAQLRPRVWPGTASLSFEALEVRISGEGRLLAQLEQRRRQLQAEGLFDRARKKRLPFLPASIGLIAGQGSDAERDVCVNLRRRWPAADVRIVHAIMQGPQSAESVMIALQALDRDPGVQVIVIARGGGSLEDLLPFSDEGLVRAVSAARTPVVSAIGHEADTPLLDLVADLRASTPTDAARRVVPDAAEESELVASGLTRIRQAVLGSLDRAERDLTQVQTRPVMCDPMASFAAHDERLHQLRHRLRQAIDRRVGDENTSVTHDLARVRTMSPKATLDRGYAILARGDATVASVADVEPGTDLLAWLADGQLDLQVTGVRATPEP